MFKKNDNVNEKIIYRGRPNIIFGCKKAFLGIILLIIVLSISGPVIQFIGEMQVYLISHIKLSLTRYAAIALFAVILIIMLYIIWQIIGWYAREYILTDSRIIVKSGVLLNRKNYMPYSTVQDINTSQSIFARLVNVGSISLYSAYDNSILSIESISNPSEVEEIIFSKIMNRPYQQVQRHQRDFEPITPVNHEPSYSNQVNDFYPENGYVQNQSHYEYEPYPDDGLERNIDRAMSGHYESSGGYDNESYYSPEADDYYLGNDDYYEDNDSELYYNDADEQDLIIADSEPVQNEDESSETVIRRHFDKFKK